MQVREWRQGKADFFLLPYMARRLENACELSRLERVKASRKYDRSCFNQDNNNSNNTDDGETGEKEARVKTV